MMYDNWHYGNNGSSPVGMFIFMLFMITIVVVGIIALVHYLNKSSTSDSRRETAMELLHKRYAQGEIDKPEFEEKRKDLNAR